MNIHTEALPLFEGAKLRDNALSRHAENHREDIQRVRLALEQWLDNCQAGQEGCDITADDIFVVAEGLGLTHGDTRWLGSIARRWDRLVHTGRYTPSTLKQRHARPVPVWRWLPKETR